MNIKLLELHPDSVINRAWVSEIFGLPIQAFSEEMLDKDVFPIFIVHGNLSFGLKDRKLDLNFLKNLDSQGISFGLLHLYDENYDHDITAYYLKHCHIVFREYFRPPGGYSSLFKDYLTSFHRPIYQTNLKVWLREHLKVRFKFMSRQYLPRLPEGKIFYIPLGYTDKVDTVKTPEIPSILDRQYRWSFCGDASKRDRPIMLRHLKILEPNFIHLYSGFGGVEHKTALSANDYWSILTQSIFIPTPLGNVNVDTYRLFESLEAGAIPIILDNYGLQPYNYYVQLLGDHLIPRANSWKDAKKLIESLSDDSIQNLSDTLRKWYSNYKVCLKQDISNILKCTQETGVIPF